MIKMSCVATVSPTLFPTIIFQEFCIFPQISLFFKSFFVELQTNSPTNSIIHKTIIQGRNIQMFD